MINQKVFEHRPISQLMAIVRQDLRKLDDEGLIDEGTLIKTVMWCNDKLGIPIREVKEITLPVKEYEAQLPLDFEKLYYTCALTCTNTSVTTALQNPFDNSLDMDAIYEAKAEQDCIAGTNNCHVTITKKTETEVIHYNNWTDLSVGSSSEAFCHNNSPNMRKPGKYEVNITPEGTIETPFRKGSLYMMYLAAMKDEEGNILFPFHPLITPWYEWCIKEKIVMDAIFNSDGNYGDLLAVCKKEKALAWMDAFNFNTDRSYGDYIDLQKKREMKWYKQYFQFFK